MFAIRKARTIPGWTLPYLAWYGFGVIHAYKPMRAILGLHHTYNQALTQLLLVIAALSAKIKPATLRRLTRLFIVGVSLLALSQFAGYCLPTGRWFGRVYGPIGSPVYLGALLAVAGVWCLPSASWPYWLSVLLALFFTQTRGAILGLMVGLVYLQCIYKKKRAFTFMYTLVLAVPLITAFSLLKKHSDSARMSVYSVCVEAIKERPWTGWGLENAYYGIQKYRDERFNRIYGPVSQDHCHNAILEAAIAGGWIGTVITLLTALFALLLSKPGRNRAMVLTYFSVSMFNPVPLIAQVFAALMFASQMRRGIEVPIRPSWLVVLSLAGAIFCSRLALIVSDESLTLTPRLEAAKKIGVAN